MEKQDLLDELMKEAVPPARRERTLFDISGNASREVVFSNWYKYFLNSFEEHGLGAVFVESLLQLIGEPFQLERFKVQTEVSTNNGNRIDILITGTGDDQGKFIIIENKIYQGIQNDLQDYWHHCPGAKNRIGILLTLKPIGVGIKGTNNFINILHSQWMSAVVKRIDQKVLTTEQQFYFSHFQNAINNLNRYNMLSDSSRFYFKNSGSINTLIKCKEETTKFITEVIRFRTIDTSQLLNAIELKKPLSLTVNDPGTRHVPRKPAIPEVPSPPMNVTTEPVPEYVLIKTMKVHFDKVSFGNAAISFSIFIEELGHEVNFAIANPDIRAEFEAIKEYFKKVLKKKLITVNIEIKYNKKELLSAKAESEDIDRINPNIIDNIRFEFVKREIFNSKGKNDNRPLINTLDTLINKKEFIAGELYHSDQQLIDDLLAIKNSKHYHHLQFLSSKHLSSVLKVRFILEPFSFLFLLAGENKYHMVWENLNSEEATYLWHFEKSIEALRTGLKEIEEIIQEIKGRSKLEYLKKEHENFSRIIHDYTNAKKGFIQWKDSLEEKLL